MTDQVTVQARSLRVNVVGLALVGPLTAVDGRGGRAGDPHVALEGVGDTVGDGLIFVGSTTPQ